MYYAAQDLIEYMMNTTGGGAQDSEHRLIRSAAHHAYRDIVNVREWQWHRTETPLPEAVAGSNGRIFILPENVNTVDAIVTFDGVNVASYITPNEWRKLENRSQTSGEPIYWTVMRSPTAAGRWQLMLAGALPSAPAGKSYYITYRRRPPPLKYMGYEPVCRNNSLTSSNAAGAVKRYGTADNFPESLAGVYPYTAQEILGLTGSLDGTPPANAKTVVSDYLDVSENMYTALLSAAEMWLARLQGKNVEGAMAVYMKDLRMAMEQDVIAPMAGRRTGTPRYPEMYSATFTGTPRNLGYYAPSGPDTGV